MCIELLLSKNISNMPIKLLNRTPMTQIHTDLHGFEFVRGLVGGVAGRRVPQSARVRCFALGAPASVGQMRQSGEK